MLPKNTAIALAVYGIIYQRRHRRMQRSYVRGINCNRLVDGHFQNLVLPMRTIHIDEHFRYFRMTPSRFDDLLCKIAPYIEHTPNHRMPISSMQRLAITLKFLVDGTSLSNLEYSYRIGRATATKILLETTVAIGKALSPEYLAPPSRAKWQEIAQQFWQKWNFPLCVGAIDGKHINIKCPPNSGSNYYNYKGFFSIVLLAVVNVDYNFIFVDIGRYGRAGDAGLFGKSELGRWLERASLSYKNGGLSLPFDKFLPRTGILAPHVFVGDQAFPLSHHLMRPYSHKSATGNERIFNYHLSRSRRVLENGFGSIVTRWRVLESKMNVSVETAENVVKACVALHNYPKATDIYNHPEPMYLPEHYFDP